MRVAILEDSEVQMATLRFAVSNLGNDVVFESDRLSEFEQAVELGADVIFLDMTLTDANPAMVVEFLMQWRPKENAPCVVMMTSSRITASLFAAAEVLGALCWDKELDSITDVIGKVSGKVSGKCQKRSPWQLSQLSELLGQRACLS